MSSSSNRQKSRKHLTGIGSG